MKVLILSQWTHPSARKDVKDVEDQVIFVTDELLALGHEVLVRSISDHLEMIRSTVKTSGADIVFNLVEDMCDSNALNPIGAMILESCGIPFTGSPSTALSMTTNKLVAKRLMGTAEICTPGLYHGYSHDPDDLYILKPVCEDASVGITYDSVVTAAELHSRFDKLGSDKNKYFAEQFINGREIFVSLVYSPRNQMMEILQPTEIIYLDHPTGVPEIMTYEAKWDSSGCPHKHTNKPVTDTITLGLVKTAAAKCARVFGLKGYARLDMVVEFGKAMVIDINANPHLGKDSYIIEAAELSGLSHGEFFTRILEAANV